MLHRQKEMVYCYALSLLRHYTILLNSFSFSFVFKIRLWKLNEGWRCITGSKMYCCPTNDRRPNDKFLIPAILFGVRDHVKLIPLAKLSTQNPIPS